MVYIGTYSTLYKYPYVTFCNKPQMRENSWQLCEKVTAHTVLEI